MFFDLSVPEPLRASPRTPASAAWIKKNCLLRTLICPYSSANMLFCILGKQKSTLGERAWRTYARQTEPGTFTRLLRSKWNFLETLLVSKIKLYQYWPPNAALGSQQLRLEWFMYSIFSLIFVGCLFLKVCSPNDSYEVAAQTMTDPPPGLTPGSKTTVGRAAFWLLFFLFFGSDQTEPKPDRRWKQFLELKTAVFIGGVTESGFEGNVTRVLQFSCDICFTVATILLPWF